MLAPLAALLACGGRYSSSRHDEPTGEAGNASSAAGSASSSAGSSSAAGAGTSPICPCDPPECAPGFTLVSHGKDCCPHCELDVVACQRQTDAYLSYRAELIMRFSSFTCTVDTDCVAFYLQNSCDDSCALTVTAARRAVVDGLNNYATSNCNPACFSDPKPNCGDTPAPFCADGHCLFVK